MYSDITQELANLLGITLNSSNNQPVYFNFKQGIQVELSAQSQHLALITQGVGNLNTLAIDATSLLLAINYQCHLEQDMYLGLAKDQEIVICQRVPMAAINAPGVMKMIEAHVLGVSKIQTLLASLPQEGVATPIKHTRHHAIFA